MVYYLTYALMHIRVEPETEVMVRAGRPRKKDDRMLFYVDPHSGVPIFRQLMDQVKLHVASGVLQPGDELPSIRSLSVPLGVNPMTISKAYNLLVHDEILERRPGKALVVADLGQGEMADRRLDQLRQSLRSSVALVRQLEIKDTEAVEIYRKLLAESGPDMGETK
jgi:GntR family transcriptional regulator